MIPPSIATTIESKLETSIIQSELVHGGDINQTFKLTSETGEKYFLKWNPYSPIDMFDKEAQGLEILSSADTEFRIPKVYLSEQNFLLLEFLEESSEVNFYNFGIQLARLHLKSNELFGLSASNYIGKLEQSNRFHSNWMDFFIRERLEPQVKLAIDSGKLSTNYMSIFERIMNFTYVIFPDEPPALLHGDLWAGNFMFTSDGKVSLYDPAVYYGHREMDIAMTTLFGGFTSDFYDGYNSIYPLKQGYKERLKLCNLYPILVHANLFGGTYISKAQQLLNRFF